MHYAGKLMTSREENVEDFRSIKKEFFKFCKGAPFYTDSVGLYKAIMNRKSDKLIGLYIDKISSIHVEDYEKAMEINNEIRRFEAEDTGHLQA